MSFKVQYNHHLVLINIPVQNQQCSPNIKAIPLETPEIPFQCEIIAMLNAPRQQIGTCPCPSARQPTLQQRRRRPLSR